MDLFGFNEPEILIDNNAARLDLSREKRKGIPEIVFAEHKQPDDCLKIARTFLGNQGSGRVMLSRVPPDLQIRLTTELNSIEYNGQMMPVTIENHLASRMSVLRREGIVRPNTGGRIGIIAAGTSDIPIAEEAGIVAREMGCQIFQVYDVGVAGLHRLFEPLARLIQEHDVDIIIVAAGMDGALPSVVTGLVNVPVIGLPTSIGYGMGGKGVGAILTMLQSCAPGLSVVNIDNGVGAGATAALTANRIARYRQK